MAGSLGKASLMMTANNAPLESRLDATYEKLQGFRSRIEGSFKSLSLGGLTKGLGGGNLAAMITPIGAAFALATGGAKLFGDAVEHIKDLGEIGKKAQSIGVASDQFQGLGLAAKKAGVEQDQFGKLMAKMTGEIATGAKPAATALASIGLSVQDLQGMAPDKQFLAIATGLKNVEGGGQRAAAAQALFGKSGSELLPMLTKGGEKLQEFIDKQKALGTVLSNTDMEKAMGARDAIPKIQAAFDGLWNKVTVAMAPVIVAVSKVFSQIMEIAQPVMDWIGRSAETTFGLYGAFLSEVIDLVIDLGKEAGSWISEMIDFGGEWPSIGEVIIAMWRTIGEAGATAWDIISAGAGTVAIGLGKLIEGYGQIEQAIVDLLKVAGELPDSLGGAMFRDAAKGAQSIVDGIKSVGSGMADWGTRQIDGFGKSADRVDKWFDKLAAKEKKVIDDFEDIAGGAMNDVAGDGGKTRGENKFILAGSTADVSATQRYNEQANDPVLDVAKKQLETQKSIVTAVNGIKIPQTKFGEV